MQHAEPIEPDRGVDPAALECSAGADQKRQLMMKHETRQMVGRLRAARAHRFELPLVSRPVELQPQPVPEVDGVELQRRQSIIEQALTERRIELHTRARVVKVAEDGAVIEHEGEQTEIEASGVIWTAGVKVNPLVEKLNVERDRRGLIVVEPSLQVRGREGVFAVGDIALFDTSKQLVSYAGLATSTKQSSVAWARSLLVPA